MSRRRRGPNLSNESFYPTVGSCQIPHLGFLFESCFGQKRDGFFIEVGGFDGLMFSNSRGLAMAGWSGHILEPVPAFANECRRNFREYANISIHELAVSDRCGNLELVVRGPLTTSSRAQAEEYEKLPWARGEEKAGTIIVPCTTLNGFLSEVNVDPDFDVLIVDVEGTEPDVFSGFSLEIWCPKMMIVELADFHPDLPDKSGRYRELRERILDQGYRVIYKDHINTVFARSSLGV